MSATKDSEGGWTAYIREWKAKHPDTVIDYKALLQQYIKGVKISG